ncbi:hypothetical protein PIB30_015986 [Stylosanthes scabra]|uniref:Uncharacterized protein n=1 Tax=Stylosanthes scabra TaxID=79078 RepID=A0ABU6X5G5_9FABA|nr:hypothetical protein [Stylosanthes scabra]
MEEFHGRYQYKSSHEHNDMSNVKGLNNNNNDNKMWLSSVNRAPTSSWDPYNHHEPTRAKAVVAAKETKSTWWWNDAERKRKRRVAKYKLYATEGKFKHSIKKGFRWLKIKWIRMNLACQFPSSFIATNLRAPKPKELTLSDSKDFPEA